MPIPLTDPEAPSHFGTSKKNHIPRDGSQLCVRFFEVEVALKGVQVGVCIWDGVRALGRREWIMRVWPQQWRAWSGDSGREGVSKCDSAIGARINGSK